MEYNDDHEAVIEDNGDGGWVDTHHNVDFESLQDEIKEMKLAKEVDFKCLFTYDAYTLHTLNAYMSGIT